MHSDLLDYLVTAQARLRITAFVQRHGKMEAVKNLREMFDRTGARVKDCPDLFASAQRFSNADPLSLRNALNAVCLAIGASSYGEEEARMKTFFCAWGAGYVDSPADTQTVDETFFNDNGYTAEDLSIIQGLPVGCCTSFHESGIHSIVRLS